MRYRHSYPTRKYMVTSTRPWPGQGEGARSPTFWTNSCGSCGGALGLCSDDRGHYKECLNCGRISPDGAALGPPLNFIEEDHIVPGDTAYENTIGQRAASITNGRCPAAPDCLECPLPACRYDDPKWFNREMKNRRRQAAATQLAMA